MHILDDESRLASSTDETLLQKFDLQHKDHPCFAVPQLKKNDPMFMINHYAGSVDYHIKVRWDTAFSVTCVRMCLSKVRQTSTSTQMGQSRDRQSDGWADRQMDEVTNRYADRPTGRQAGGWTDRQAVDRCETCEQSDD